MAVSSNMLELGTPLPAFSLPDTVSGRTVSSQDLSGKPALVMFICNHCPYVKRIQKGLVDFGRYCDERGVRVVAISSNDPGTYPDDAPDKMALEAKNAIAVVLGSPRADVMTSAPAATRHSACSPSARRSTSAPRPRR